eukprot:633780-Pyramimonas_sp.AAC.1
MWASEQAILSLAQGIRRAGCTLSNKSVIMASSPTLAQDVAQALQGQGIAVRLNSSGRDLGCDATLGEVRKLQVRQTRQRKGFVRLAKTSKLSKGT